MKNKDLPQHTFSAPEPEFEQKILPSNRLFQVWKIKICHSIPSAGQTQNLNTTIKRAVPGMKKKDLTAYTFHGSDPEAKQKILPSKVLFQV